MTRIACLFVPAAAERVQPALLEIALRHSPSVEDGGPGIVYLDLGGLERLWGGEREIAARLQRAARESGAAARGGRAGPPRPGPRDGGAPRPLGHPHSRRIGRPAFARARGAARWRGAAASAVGA